MVSQKNTLVKFAALLLTATVVTPATNDFLARGSALAQSFGDNPESFPIPSSLPDGTTLKVDGSTSMRVTNQALESRFESQYPNIDVELDASRTDEAIAALLDGNLDLVATGRPLTDEEKAQGLVEVPLEREKLAILLGPTNEFAGNLTFEQFAQIFRGEITNWSELGGPDRPIRLVDRPEYSDTRRALSTYEVFQGKPFETGNTADPVAEDETQTVLEALGEDGIGYAVYSQVQGLDTVRVLPMHETLPDDPRYPYSQYRAYVYREDASPAILAFLGFATTQPGQEVIADVPDAAIAEPAEVEADAGAVAEPAEAEADAGAVAETPEEETTALVPDGAVTDDARGRFPWWLLGIPILGGLLWWLLRGLGGGAPAAAPVAAPMAAVRPEPRMVLTPRNCRDAYAYWEIPSDRHEAAKRQGGEKMKVRLYDVTGRDRDAALPPHTAEFDCVGTEPDLHLPIKIDDHDYLAEVGYLTSDYRWLPLAKSESVRVPACPKPTVVQPEVASARLGAVPVVGAAGLAAGVAGAAAMGAKSDAPARIILTPRNCRDAYVYWEIPNRVHEDCKRQGGHQLVVRLYDVTGRAKTAELPVHTAQFDWGGPEPDLHLPIQMDDRDYRAEVGYLTQDNRWLPIAKSEPVHVPACPKPGVRPTSIETREATTKAGFPGVAIAGAAAVGATAVGAAAIGAGQHLKDAIAPDVSTSRIVMTPRNPKKAYVYWEVPEKAKARAKAEGGKDYQLRIYDATDIDIDKQPPHNVLTYDVEEDACDRFVPLPAANRDYIAEIGYRAEDGTWLDLARSHPVRADVVLGQSGSKVAPLGVAAGIGTAAVASAVASPAVRPTTVPAPPAPAPVKGNCAIQTVQVHSRHNAVQLNADQMRHLQDTVSCRHALDKGLYVLKIREGAFNYDGDESHPGEPFVLLWIYGGRVINRKTGVPVNATWSTLNGYAETLTLEVNEPAQVCAFFMDTFPDDNIGEVTLSVIQL